MLTRLRILAMSFLLPSVACSSNGTKEPADTQFPSDTSVEGIEAFLDGEHHLTWAADASPRSSDDPNNPHGDELRVFFNDRAVAAGNDGPPGKGSMVVKQLRQGGALVGHAASLRTSDDTWLFYCDSDSGLCSTAAEALPVYGEGTNVSCGFCHGNRIAAPVPSAD